MYQDQIFPGPEVPAGQLEASSMGATHAGLPSDIFFFGGGGKPNVSLELKQVTTRLVDSRTLSVTDF